MPTWFSDFFGDLFARIGQTSPAQAVEIEAVLKHKLLDKTHGDFERWLTALNGLPELEQVTSDFNSSSVSFSADNLNSEQSKQIAQALKGLMPWRKGPFQFFDTHIDTEWRSDFKWSRVCPHLSSLKHRRVLDVGCGSGYHMWRMLSEGATEVVGVDPSILFLMQFQAAKKYARTQLAQQNTHIDLLPITLEQLPSSINEFDTVFSMGILYHRPDPIGHLQDLKSRLRAGGELLLETLVIEGDKTDVLMPDERYAQMRNVWFIPSVEALLLWCKRAGFKEAKLVDINVTSIDEQRRTDWMQYQSLSDFLDPNDATKTIEGYPAPLRASILASC